MSRNLPKVAYALVDDVKPFHYNILWSLDFDSLTFQGEVFIGLTANRSTRSIRCHSAELSIPNPESVWIAPLNSDHEATELELSEALESGCYTRDGDNIRFPDLENKFSPKGNPVFDEKQETVTLDFETPLSEGSLYLLRIRFQGVLNGNMVGLYRCSYTNAKGEQKVSACTQFEPTDARRAFPCWDEPNLKASFDVTVGYPVHMTGLGNMPEVMVKTILPSRGEEEQKAEDVEGVIAPASPIEWQAGQKVSKFATLPTMSTYLVATVVGEYDFIGTRLDDRVDLRIFTPIGKTDSGRFALKVASAALLFYENYFGMKYPLPKLDLIGIPDFGSGAMENSGLITYRESRLLLDAEKASPAAKEAASRTICHEIAHQWFGNSTTMYSWTYLYLNEAFARLTEFLGVNHVYPEWNIWTQFIESVHTTALSLDGLANTHAIEVEVKSPAEINEVFDIISYAKGASVLKMIHGWVGEENFMRGIRTYLKTHAESNAISDDLWKALGDAAGMPDLVKSIDNWIREPGYPAVTVELEGQSLVEAAASGAYKVRVHQKHFLSSGGKSQPAPSDTLWTIPLTFGGPGVKISEDGGMFRHIVKDREAVVEIPADSGAAAPAIIANLNRDGFYRVLYKGALWEAVLEQVARPESIHRHDLIGLVSDTVALMNANLLPVEQFLRLVKVVYARSDLTIEAVLKCGIALRGLSQLHRNHPKSADLLKLLRSSYEPIFQRLVKSEIGLNDRLNQRLFCSSLSILAATSHEEAIAYITKALDQADDHPSWLKDTVYPLGVKYGGKAQWDLVRSRIETSDNDAEQRKRLLMSVGATRDAELQKETLLWALKEDRSSATAVRVSEVLYVFAGLAANDEGAQLVWKHISSNWDEFYGSVGKTGPLFGHCVSYSLTGFSGEADAQAVEDFFQKNPCEEVVRVVRQGLERIRERVFRKETQSPQLTAIFP